MRTATMRHLPTTAQRPIHWYRSREIGAAEIIIVPLLVIAAIAFHRLTEAQIQALDSFRQMDSIASMFWWEVSCVGLAALIVAGVLFSRRVLAAAGFLGASVVFGSIGIIIWHVSHTWLTPALYYAFALGSAKRCGELIGRGAADGNRPH